MQPLERLDAFRLSRDLAVRIDRMTKQEPLRREFGLADQIRRAAISVPANLAEAYALGTHPQIIRGLRIALGSAEELRTHLWIAERVAILPPGESSGPVRADVDRVVRMLVGLLKRYRAKAAS